MSGLKTKLMILPIFVGGIIFFPRPYIPARLNGEPFLVRRGITIGQMLKGKRMHLKRGDLYDTNGQLLREGCGEPPIIWLNGRRAGLRAVVKNGDSIIAANGRHRRERELERVRLTSSNCRVVGRGAILSLIQEGLPGIEIERTKAYTGKLCSRRMSRSPRSTIFHRTDLPTVGKVALTFDDGPDPKYTPKVLEILRQNGIKATFFVIGERVKRYPEIIREEIMEGHEIGNHTLSHPNLPRCNCERIHVEIEGCEEILRRLGAPKPRYFRPPKGAINGEVFKIAREKGYQVILWSVAMENSSVSSSKEMQKKVVEGIGEGGVILAHDGGLDRTMTIRALPGIIKKLKERGFKFVTLSELFQSCGSEVIDDLTPELEGGSGFETY
ncbi:MAG: polysaccharide deacetylase family protein [Actinomycetota bacterium]|nr:polysaccharide deacetylase family protein [Actinomycetota bacterium]